ncbi:hypothetical protein COCCU_07610 [Corynebacterium occultum]|uniref:Uncharacterized protein n=1 Tax=Corynebacterium occultum TaxID=2675219 RepID=A0A6B8W835_9CORY|nr:hypothetical protein [Corynebacterium occultum]QGU07455.1 hypothetical protein COCCU_07610 [Corynebacterium occultum]
MNDPAPMMWHRIMSAAWRITLVIAVLWGCLAGSADFLPTEFSSEPGPCWPESVRERQWAL